MALTSSDLVGYLRSQFARAGRLRVWLFLLQLASAMPAAVAIVIPDHYGDALYWLALFGATLLFAWWAVNERYSKIRDAAQSALRGALLLGGLEQPLSASEVQALRERFVVSEEEARKFNRADYYATKLEPGPPRLGEMLEESAFYSERLQQFSSQVMLWILLSFAIIAAVISFGIAPYVGRDSGHTIVRVFMALLVFGMSSDDFGAYLAHKKAAKGIRDVRQRLIAADAFGYPIADVLLAFSDYNSAIESAPESVPFAYGINATELNQRWADYQRDRSDRRSATGRKI